MKEQTYFVAGRVRVGRQHGLLVHVCKSHTITGTEVIAVIKMAVHLIGLIAFCSTIVGTYTLPGPHTMFSTATSTASVEAQPLASVTVRV